jgi:signal transduction histidine kinase
MKDLEILILDDDPIWTRTFCDILLRLRSPSELAGPAYTGYKFHHVTNQREAEVAASAPGAAWDLILLDLDYPVEPTDLIPISRDPSRPLQGMCWLPKLRLLQPRAAIVIVTAYPEEDDLKHIVAAVRNSHADDFVPKTADSSDIVGRVSMAIQNSHQRQKMLLLEREWRRLTRNGAARVYQQDVRDLLAKLRNIMDSVAQRIESGDALAIIEAPKAIRAVCLSLTNDLDERTRILDLHLSIGKKLKRAVDLSQMIHDFLLRYDLWLEEAKATSQAIVHETRLEVTTLVDDLKMALHEVITNAIEALAIAGRPPGKRVLTVMATQQDNTFIIQIDDNGDGFSDEALANIFQLGRPLRDSGEHVGMGLYVARRSMYALGGDIKVENRPEGGARVRLFIPNLK